MNTKTILAAPAYLHETLLHDLLDTHHTNALDQLAVAPFNALLPKAEYSSSYLLEKTFERIQTVADKCPHFVSMIHNPSFLKQLSDFRKDMAEYQIDIIDLPENDDFQKELKILIQCFYDLPVSSMNQIEYLNSTEPMHHVQIYPSYLSSLFSSKVISHMIKCGAQMMDQPQVHSYKTGRTALNRRQEIEACAQYIIEQNLSPEDITIVLCDSANDQKLIKMVFDRYHLPYGFVSTSEKSKVVQLFLSIMQYLKDQSLNSLIQYFHCACSDIEHFDAFIDYINMFIENTAQLSCPFTHVKDTFDQPSIFDERQKKQLIELEELAESVRSSLSIPEGQASLITAYDLVRQHSVVKDTDELKVFYRIKEILEAHYEVIHDEHMFDLICFEIESLNKSTSHSFINQICVTDLTHPVPVRKQAFVLGCIQSSFPDFKGCSGIFDEDYVSQVPGYPKKAVRQAFHFEQIAWIFNCAENIIFSASCADYEGKGRQMSIEIESRLDEKPVPWNIIKHQKKHRVEFKIQPDTAKDLFLKEGKLHGSISSFEKWFNCPASYFLSTGLRLRKQEYPEFNIALMGTLQHAILEEVMGTYHKNIHECTEEKLSEIVEKMFAPVIQLFTKKRSFLSVAKNRCARNMTLIFEFLNEMEQNTDFEPKKMEQRFKTVLLDDQTYSVQIQGIIDRIDMTHDMLRVLDYKSSHKSLSVSKIQSGLQLQLLTYLYVASELYHKTAAGCYYVSMKNDDIKAPVSKVDGRKLEIIDPDSTVEMDLWKQSHRLDGMTFEDTNMLDFDGTHIKGFKNGRPTKTYMIEDLTGFIQTIYQYLIDQVAHGHIALTPTEDACTFCDHFSICRFHSLKIKSIVPEELTAHFFKEVK